MKTFNRKNDAFKILDLAEENDLMAYGNVWIVCDDILINRTFVKDKNGKIFKALKQTILIIELNFLITK